MKSYYRVILGEGNKHFQECRDGSFIGTDFLIREDLTNKLPERWGGFNKEFIPVWLDAHPGKSKIAAGLACGTLWTVSKGIHEGDIVLCPDGKGMYLVGELVGGYTYHPEGILPHRRSVRWFPQMIARADMSRELRNSTGSIGTSSQVTKHAEEIERLLGGQLPPELLATDHDVEDPVVFALEKHLEDFLIANWEATALGKTYNIYEIDGELVGRQFQTDTGVIDILGIWKDNKELLVVELKKGRVSDVVVGQIQRYMGYVLDELAENDQTVKGIIIGLEDDLRLRRALRVTQNIEFYRYEVDFKIIKVDVQGEG